MIDALLQELELEIAYPVKDEQIELIEEIEENESLAKDCHPPPPELLAESIKEVKRASSSETMIQAEGKFSPYGSHLTGRF